MGGFGRNEILDALKRRLLAQYGKSPEGFIDGSIDALLASQRKISKQDVDELEQSVSAYVKRRRWGTSDVGFDAVTGGGIAGGSATGPPVPPVPIPKKLSEPSSRPPAAAALPRVPSTSGAGLQASARSGLSRSDGALPLSTGRTPASSRAASVRSTGALSSAVSSRVNFKPKYSWPMKPMKKPMDHWDLMVKYDKEKYDKEQIEGLGDKHASQQAYRDLLDKQMIEVYGRRQEMIEDRQRDRDVMAMERENYEQAEARREEENEKERARQRYEFGDRAMRKAEGKKRREEEEKRRDGKEIADRMERQREADIEAEKRKRIMWRNRNQEMKDTLHRVTTEKQRKREEEFAEDKAMARRYLAMLDQQEEEKRLALEKRKEHINKIANTMGAAQGAAMAAQEKADEERMLRALAKAEREAKEAARQKEAAHKRRVDDMLASLDQQMVEKTEALRQEKLEAERQAEIWAAQAQEALQKEEEKLQRVRHARQSMDNFLVKQMKFQIGVHSEHRVNPTGASNEMKYNGPLLRRIRRDENFDVTQLPKVVNRMGSISKLGGGTSFDVPDLGEAAYPLPEKRRLGSVPPYEGEITDTDMALASGNA